MPAQRPTKVRLIHWHEQEATERGNRLRASGFVVDAGQLDPEKLRQLGDDPPDVVLIDLSRLPMQGRDVGIWLRQRKATRHVPIVFVGGDPDKVIRVEEHLPDVTYTSWDEVALAVHAAHPPREPVVPSSSLAGYAGTPLPKKLGIKPSSVTCLVGAPARFDVTLGNLPPGAALRWSNRGKRDLTIWFAASRRDLEQRLTRMREIVAGGPLWIAWPKQASGVQTDLTQNVVRQAGLAAGLVDYKVAAIDETWSGLLFTERKT